MAKRRTKKAAARAHRKASKEAGMGRPGMKSNYAKKREWCKRNGKWGFEVLSPKPWKSL